MDEQNLVALLETGSEDQKLARIATLQEDTEEIVSLHLQRAPEDARAAALALETILRRKVHVLDATAGGIEALRRQLDGQARKLLDELGRLRSELATKLVRGSSSGDEPDDARHQELQDRIDALEAELSQRSRQYRAATLPVTIEGVQALLPSESALVEIFLYRPHTPRVSGRDADPWGAARYAVYVLLAQGAPRAVDLGDAAAIDALVKTWRAALQKRLPAAREHARALDARIMAPVRALLGNARQLFVAPDGDLTLIPFAALVDEQNQYLIERYSITYLTSGRDLLRQVAPEPARQGPVVVANPQFDTGALPAPLAGVLAAATQGMRDLLGLVATPLPATAQEAAALRMRLAQLHTLTGAEATEAAVKQVQGPLLLHIATHGFWLQDAEPMALGATRQPAFTTEPPARSLALITDPMLRSGLALAGFNTRQSGTDDGFLTALEVSSMDLSGTPLVMLSACDTGLGEVKHGQGVFGLRRALVLAGAQTQVMSLWKVDDAVTRDLVIAYYDRLLTGEGRSEAMRRAQLTLLRNEDTAHPYYWASFLVAGNPSPMTGLMRRLPERLTTVRVAVALGGLVLASMAVFAMVRRRRGIALAP